jgi:transposase
VPVLPSWLINPLWEQFSALLPDRPRYDPSHPLGCHRPRVPDRVIFEKLIQVMRFSCSYEAIADSTCGATTIRERRDEWIELGIFRELKTIARDAYDRLVGLELRHLLIDGCITKAPGGGECAGRSPVDRGKQGMKRSSMTEGNGIPIDRVLAPANRHDSVLFAETLDKIDDLGPLPDGITVHLDAACNSQKTRDELEKHGMTGDIARKGEKAPLQAGQRWPVERTNAWHNSFARLQRCYERNEEVINAFFDLADAIITLRRLIREAWTLYRWDTRPANRPLSKHLSARPLSVAFCSGRAELRACQRDAGRAIRRFHGGEVPCSMLMPPGDLAGRHESSAGQKISGACSRPAGTRWR